MIIIILIVMMIIIAERSVDREGDAGISQAIRSPWSSFVAWLVAQRPSSMLVYLRDGSAQTILRASALR